jgi:hypothetical protein
MILGSVHAIGGFPQDRPLTEGPVIGYYYVDTYDTTFLTAGKREVLNDSCNSVT